MASLLQRWLLRRLDQSIALALQVRRCWPLWLAGVIAYGWALDHVRVNVSHSLPFRVVYLEHAPEDLRRGDLVVFRYVGGDEECDIALQGAPFFKRIRGVAGDRISVDGRSVRINGEPVGLAKPRSWDDLPLNVIRPGVIPVARYYMQGDGPDSFDSRYARSGLVGVDQIAGRAWVLF
ncbi:S26 family signal peptidase [Actimicrobium sp. CCI2.3]|uniref:S26 family signal peptidase n=1 Tax=Actimicrobium sp. CCI2.3 TaxID=3048616 RepID=UPI002AB4CB1B|nr:S26 family signal peptidase [Actimicrobium sp. CCI2.3]MDY7574444.1 S26 family signal peptidase [Actimicrobium sp. CCI2.3]MEB0022478.1 S26 family signal peptidase [Actimicrobium sp. CCI2.3]